MSTSTQTHTQSTACPACKGTGRYTEDPERPCPYCRGLGAEVRR